MAVETVVVHGTAPKDATDHDLTSSGFGTPEAAIIFLSDSYSGTNPNTGAAAGSIGFWVAGSPDVQKAAGIRSGAGGSSSTQTSRFLSSASSAGLPNGAGTAIGMEYSVSDITDGIRLNLSAGSTSVERYVYAILFKGLTNKKLAGDNDTASIGFRPDLVFSIGVGNTTGAGTNAILSYGVAHFDSSDTITQGYVGYSNVNNVSDTVTSQIVNDAHITAQVHNNAISWEEAITAVDSNGFTVENNRGTDTVFYLCLELGDPDDASVGTFTSPTSATTKAVTGLGFQPQIVGLAGAGIMAKNGVSATADVVVHFGASDDTTDCSAYIASEDNVGTTVEESGFSSSAIVSWSDATSTSPRSEAATLQSFDSGGFTLSYSDAESSAYQTLYWAIKGEADTTTLSDPTATSIDTDSATVGCTLAIS